MRRTAGTVFGIGTHALFAVTVWYLFHFLYQAPEHSTAGSLWIDLLLALQFAVPHSVLLYPAVRERLTDGIVPRPFYGCLHCSMTCVSLLATFFWWRTSPVVVWSCSGPLGAGITVAFFLSWVALFYTLHLSGLGYQTGWTPWWHWLRNRSLPPRKFQPRSAYLWLRHPVYLSFLGLIWFNPVLTLDRLLLAGVWTAYIFAGSCLKDRRLLYYLGDEYRSYQARVPGYPFMPFGPLARIPWRVHEPANSFSVSTHTPISSEPVAAGG